jgi:KDO2-lipid IV(A) lauroyltransferase
MDAFLYWIARVAIFCLSLLPLPWVARMGRMAGTAAYHLDARHRRVALKNLQLCFGDQLAPARLRALARENFRRIGENFACGIRTAFMRFEELRPFVDLVVPLDSPGSNQKPPPSVVTAIGHFGNFELYARIGQFQPEFKCATTYRALRQPSLNRLLQSSRERSGCLYFERRTEAAALKSTMNQPGVMLGLLADQHAGDNGLRLPFLGHDCSTSAAPAVLALRYGCPLYTGFCYRVGLGRWHLQFGQEIPTRVNGRPREIEAIMLDVNRAFEVAVRRDPANWFWVHNRWKPGKWRSRPEPEPHPGNPSIP